MKKKLLVILICILTVFCFSCSSVGWKGLYEEDLSEYLTLADYTKFTYKKPNIEVTQAEVDARISTLLEAATTMEEVDKKLASGMTVCFDRFCFINGQAKPELSFEGGVYSLDGTQYENEAVNLLLPKLVGMKKGDTATLEITLSDNTKATYKVTVLAVYEKNVMTLTDAVASKLVPGCNTVSELKTEIQRRMTAEKEREAEKNLISDLRKQLIDKSTLKRTPYSLYRDYYEDRMYLYEKLAKTASMTLEEYLEKCTDMTYEELEEAVGEAASDDVKETLVLYSVVKKENISSTKEEISKFAEKMASESEGIFESGEEYLSYYGENAVKDEYLWSKVMEIVLSEAKSVE
ncbi:MAG: hypothetical protein IJ404_03950 [Clostridia bacterium]|nr:hypothetical protein [Clostridia bacterium]